MSFQLYSVDQLNSMFEDIMLYKPETPHLKPRELILD
jgi:hypothetical protein